MDPELLIKVLLAIIFGFAGGWIVKSILAANRIKREERNWSHQLDAANEARESANRKVHELQARCKELESSFASLQSEMTGIRDNMELREKSVNALRADLFDAKSKIEEVDTLRAKLAERDHKLAERDQKLIEINKARAELARNAIDTSGLESTRAELDMLSARATQLETQNADLIDERASLKRALGEAEQKVRQAAVPRPDPSWSAAAGANDNRALVATLERKVNQREAVIEQLRGELKSTREHVSSFQQKLRQIEARNSEADASAPPVKPDAAVSPDANKRTDDLTRIRGIGPKLANALNELGIVRYHQLAQMGEKELSALSEKLTSFKDRPLRDDWIGQAKGLVEISSSR